MQLKLKVESGYQEVAVTENPLLIVEVLKMIAEDNLKNPPKPKPEIEKLREELEDLRTDRDYYKTKSIESDLKVKALTPGEVEV